MYTSEKLNPWTGYEVSNEFSASYHDTQQICHMTGYNLAEELETEMTYTAVQDNKLIPTGIDAVRGCSTHVTFDNFDRFVDTTSGKDTMHDTVGIIYQFPCAENEHPEDIEATTSSTLQLDDNRDECGPSSRKMRCFNEISREIRPVLYKTDNKYAVAYS